ncbi:MAG: ABC transporter permease [Firmicutes bacterium]|nr:ABC transporter permease [Bacillota bacterium]
MEARAELFQPIEPSEEVAYAFTRPATTYWRDAWRRLRQNRMAMIGMAVIALLFLLAIFGPLFSPYSYSDQDLTPTGINQPPSLKHWFGTDALGRDLFVRVLYGARISLSIGIFASLIILVIGVTYGGISGYFGGKIDNVMMRIVDVLYGIPTLLIVILLMVVFKPGLKNIMIAIGATYWIGMARIVRGQILSLKEQDYAMAAVALGASRRRILFRHLIPNSIGPIIVTATLSIPEAIFTEAFLSFIGLGVAAPMASWGVLASEGLNGLRSYPWQLLFPGLAICLAMLAFNFFGDGLRDALDPWMRR